MNGGSVPDLVEIEYFTDPLCSWSWGFEPQWRRLRFEFGPQLRWRYRMGGMIAAWEQYCDPLNCINRPLQMAPQWLEVRHLSGMPIDPQLWLDDPPESSYPASIAFKAAEQQSPAIGERYLRRLREAVMMERRNIARRDVLLRLAEEVSTADAAEEPFDVGAFEADLDGPVALEAFREDLKLARYRDIGRFPTLILRNRASSPDGLMLVGYRPYPMLREALLHVAKLEPARNTKDAAAFREFWGNVVPREAAESMEVG